MTASPQDLTSDSTNEIRECLLTYGEDILKTKFPHYVDGLKDVSRRILWFTRNQRTTRSFLRVMGDIIENHVAGDSSVYGAIIRLGQPFMVGHPLIKIEGKSGSYHSPHDSAAPRYLNMAISEFARDIFFNGVHPSTIPMVPAKIFGTFEPEYLIPKLPTALLLGNLTVGFGFKSTTPMIDFEDICHLVMIYAEYYEKHATGLPDAKKIAPYLIPSFPINNIITNKRELLHAYCKKEYTHPINQEGWVDLTGNNITLRSLPYGVDFGTVTSELRETMRNKKHWLWDYITSANQFSSSEAEFTMEIKRGLNPFLVLNKLKATLKFSRKWTPIYSYMKSGRAITLYPDTLTALWYHERYLSIAGGLKYKQAEIISRKMTVEAILQICEHTKQVIELIRKSENEEDAVRALFSVFKQLTHKQAKIIVSQPISTLARANKAKLEQELEQLNEDMASILSQFGHINETIYQDAQLLSKKYSSTRQTKFAEDYLGCVQFGNQGITHFFTMENLYDLLNSRGWNGRKYIYFFTSGITRYCLINNKLIEDTNNTRDVLCQKYILGDKYADSNQLLVVEPGKGAHIYSINKPAKYPDDFVYAWIPSKFTGILRNGTQIPMNIGDMQIKRKAASQLIYGYNPKIKMPVIIHMNTHDANNIRIYVGTEKFSTVPAGQEYVLAVVKHGTKEVFLNIPSQCTKGNSTNFVTLTNLDKLTPGKQCIININKNQKYKISKHPSVRSWIYIDVAPKETAR